MVTVVVAGMMVTVVVVVLAVSETGVSPKHQTRCLDDTPGSASAAVSATAHSVAESFPVSHHIILSGSQ